MDNEFIGLSISEAVTLAIQESYEDLLSLNDIIASNEAKELNFIMNNKDLQVAMTESSYTSDDLLNASCGGKYRYSYGLNEAQKKAAAELDAIHEGILGNMKDTVTNVIAKFKNRFSKIVSAVRARIAKFFADKLKGITEATINAAYNKIIKVQKAPMVRYFASYNDANGNPASFGTIINNIYFNRTKKVIADLGDLNNDSFESEYKNYVENSNLEVDNYYAGTPMWKDLHKVDYAFENFSGNLNKAVENALKTAESKITDKSKLSTTLTKIATRSYKLIAKASSITMRMLYITYTAVQKVLYVASTIK